jgi:hypothetical protein
MLSPFSILQRFPKSNENEYVDVITTKHLQTALTNPEKAAQKFSSVLFIFILKDE